MVEKMNEITEILTIEVTTVFRNVDALPKLTDAHLAKLIKASLKTDDYGVDDVVVTKQQRFIREVDEK